MTSAKATGGAHFSAGEGLELRFGPNRIQFKVDELCGATGLCLMTSSFPPGAGYPFLHVHRSFEEMFYVLEGEVAYQLGGDRVVARAGSTIFIAAGTPHRFKGVGAGPARIIVVYSTPRALTMIKDIVDAGPDRNRHAEIFLRHDSYLIAD